MEVAVWYYASWIKAPASLEGGRGGERDCFSSRVISTRRRSQRLLVSTTQVSITCRSTMAVARIAECSWILQGRGLPSVHVPGNWWSALYSHSCDHIPNPYTCLHLGSTLLSALWLQNQILYACISLFPCILYTLGCWEKISILSPVNYFWSILNWQRLFNWN